MTDLRLKLASTQPALKLQISQPGLKARVLPGIPGDDGASATIAVGTVTTLSTGSPATVVNVGTSSAAIFDFGIPQGAPGGVTPSALTRVNDTNVTLTLGGTPATALLQAASLTLGWSGRLALSRLATGTAGYMLQGNGASDPVYAGFVQAGTGAITRTWQDKAREIVSVDDFGAVGDGVADDTTNFANALAALGTTGGYVVLSPSKKYLFDNNLTVPAGCAIVGALKIAGNPSAGNSTASDIWNYGSRLIVNSIKTITLLGGASIEGCFIVRKGMTGPENDASAYAGTAVTAGGDDVMLRSCLMVGFSKLFTSTNFQRASLDHVQGDGVNGFEIINALDVPTLLECHLWPFGTIDATTPVTTFGTGHYLHRTGVGYLIQTVGDQCRLTACFDYGHQQAFRVNDANNVTLNACHADDISQGGTPYTVPGSVGFLVDGTSNETVLNCCQAFAKANCFYQDMTTPTTQRATYLGCTARYFSDNGFAHVDGMATYIGCRVSGVSNTVGSGINVVASNGTVISACNFYNVNNGIVRQAVADVRISSNNHFLTCGTNIAETTPSRAIASAATITLDPGYNIFRITGTTTITSIPTTFEGHMVTLRFDGILTFTDGAGQLRLNGNFVTAAESTITLICSDTVWWEVARKP